MPPSKQLRRLLLSALILLAAIPYFVGLGSSSLWDSNEAFYAETPREMIESGDYLNPSFNYQPRFNKPPLCYWVVAGFYTVFGVSEHVERIPIALAAMILIATAFWLGRAAHSTEAGLLAAIALAANPRFFMFSRRIIIDVWLAMFMGLSLLFFVFAEHADAQGDRRKARLHLILMYACVALAVLTKGPVGLLLPGIGFFVYLAVTKSFGRIKELMLPIGALIIAAIVVPWYAAVYAQHGWKYIEAFVLGDNISRYTEPTWGPRRGIFFYIPVLLGDMFPWSIFLVGWLAGWLAIVFRLWSELKNRVTPAGSAGVSPACLANRQYGRRDACAPSRTVVLLAIWIAVIFLFFSFSSNKEDLYILPSYPAAAALVGIWLARMLDSMTRDWAALFVGLILSVVGATIVYIVAGPSGRYEITGTYVIGFALMAGGLVAVVWQARCKHLVALVAIASAVIVLNWTLALRGIGSFERYKPVRPFCDEIRKEAGPGALIGYYRFAAPSMVFYLRRPIFEHYDPDQLGHVFGSGAEVYCLMSVEDYESLKDSLPAPTRILASSPVLRVKLGNLLAGAEPSKVVLVSNRAGANNTE